MMRISDLRFNNYAILANQPKERRDKNIETLKYIEQLAMQTATDISEWDLKEIFGEGVGRNFFADKPRINKHFFAHINTLKSKDLKTALSVVTEGMREVLAQAAKEGAAFDHENAIVHRRNAADLMIRADRELHRAWAFHLRFLAVEKRSPNFVADAIERVHREGFWSFERIEGSRVYFVTNAEITLGEKNPAAGLNYSVNMGKFRAKLDIGSAELRVGVHSNNILTLAHPHPHVGSGAINGFGGLCWGSAGPEAAMLLSEMKIDMVMRLLAHLLCSYSANNPYVPLHRFYEARLALDAAKAKQKSEEKKKTVEDKKKPTPTLEPRPEMATPTLDIPLSIMRPITYFWNTDIDTHSATISIVSGSPETTMASPSNGPNNNAEERREGVPQDGQEEETSDVARFTISEEGSAVINRILSNDVWR